MISCLRAFVLLLASAILIQQPGGAQTARTALETIAAKAKTFYLDSRAGNSQVSAESESTLEAFIATCNKVAGACVVDPRHVESLRGRFSIRVNDLSTNITLRDQHMMSSDWLDEKQYPEVIVEIERAQDVQRTAPNAATVTLVGKCTLHGVTRPIRIPDCSLAYLDESPETMKKVKGDIIRVRAAFDVKLADYGITGPPGGNMVGLKVGEIVSVKATVFGSTEKPPDPLKADTKPAAASGPSPAPPKRSSPQTSKEP